MTTNQSNNLRPCPFCGSADIKVHDEIVHAVWCQECFSEVESIDIESAIKLWNTRPIEDALHARIAELEEKQRWIPVSERLPKDLQSVVIITNDSMTGIVRYLELYGSEGFGAWSEGVTHWMPLPNPPEVK